MYLQDGYDANIQEVKLCLEGSPIFRPMSGTLNISNSCDVSSNACAVIQPFSTFTMELGLFDPITDVPLPVEGHTSMSYDVCAGTTVIPDLMKFAMVAFGIPPICPVTQPTKHCYDEVSSLFTINEHLRRLLPLYSSRGAFKIVVTTLHDTGTSCLEVIASFKNTKRNSHKTFPLI